ncbi:heavy-metal-associated domain-containing protein [Pseudacidovorax sp. RU35E]|uniref:heavy-metal-associated domain-containing protein n=1 Tax=Pseudacidovorax sp. RU35E TaxID=1907403 RepID=UPI000954A9CB|nr:heavy-metal-associated domain-containing protein [Pseudacidovorax sp. RU35E]SIQ33310.1 copper chaperone [Pseudacidovorax sp. RU35E]
MTSPLHVFQVSGMSCQHCVRAVTRAVQDVDPDAEVRIDLPAGRVEVQSTETSPALQDAIREAGYTVQG